MKHVYRSLLLLVLQLSLAMTVFAQQDWVGPLLVTGAIFSGLYALVKLYQLKPKVAEVVVEFLANLFLFWQ